MDQHVTVGNIDPSVPDAPEGHDAALSRGAALSGGTTASLGTGEDHPVLATSHNQALSQFEIYRSGVLAGFIRYSMNGRQLWLLYTQVTKRSEELSIAGDLIRYVLDDAGRHRVAVYPFCPAIRRFMCEHPSYIQLVPQEERERFQLPNPAAAVQMLRTDGATAGKMAPFLDAMDGGVRREPRRRRNRRSPRA